MVQCDFSKKVKKTLWNYKKGTLLKTTKKTKAVKNTKNYFSFNIFYNIELIKEQKPTLSNIRYI